MQKKNKLVPSSNDNTDVGFSACRLCLENAVIKSL